MKRAVSVGLVILLIVLGVAAFFILPQIRGAFSLFKPAPDISTLITEGDSPFKLPEGFSASLFAERIPGARVMARDAENSLWVSQTSEGTISRVSPDGKKTEVIFRNLNSPHGLAFYPTESNILYVAEEEKISRVRIDSPGASFEKIADLPGGGGHNTRTIEFGPDNRLYVSIGSSCNVCHEADARRASILVMDKDGKNQKTFATGLRNTVFFDWSYVDGRMWGTDMGRDLLGDDIPPDEINILKEEGKYGWPICYGKNVHDDAFDTNIYIRNPCMEPFEISAAVEIPAHSAPLGLAFVPEEGWTEAMWYDLIVSYHGSWNRSEPTGYKLVRIPLDANGNETGPIEDFMTGFRTEEGVVIGRPVDILIQPGGTVYVSDDRAGVIYKISRTTPI